MVNYGQLFKVEIFGYMWNMFIYTTETALNKMLNCGAWQVDEGNPPNKFFGIQQF